MAEDRIATVFGEGAPPPVEARIPPHNLEAEAAILSASLNDRLSFDRCAETLRPEHFYSEAHRRMWEGCLAIGATGGAPDVVSVGEWLRANDRLAQVGGLPYMTTVLNAAPALSNVAQYAQIVFEHWRVRQALLVMQRGVAQGYGPIGSIGGAQEYLNGFAEELFALTTTGTKREVVPIKTALHGVFTQLQRANARGARITGLSTGFDRYDRVTSGLHPAELTVIAARPGMGKTSLVLDMAQNVAGTPAEWPLDKPDPATWINGVIVFSLEMPLEQVVMRMLASRARVDLGRMRTGMLGPTDWEKLTRAAGELAAMPIWIDEQSDLSMVELRAKTRRIWAEAENAKRSDGKKVHIAFVAVDYLQLMRGGGDNREQEIAGISRDLKRLAKDLQIPVVALAQLNRQVENRGKEGKRPQLSDLRESGAIEQDADNVCFVYRDDYYNKETEDRNLAELIIAKQRNGPTDTVRVGFDGAHTRFWNLAESEYDEEGQYNG